MKHSQIFYFCWKIKNEKISMNTKEFLERTKYWFFCFHSFSSSRLNKISRKSVLAYFWDLFSIRKKKSHSRFWFLNYQKIIFDWFSKPVGIAKMLTLNYFEREKLFTIFWTVQVFFLRKKNIKLNDKYVGKILQALEIFPFEKLIVPSKRCSDSLFTISDFLKSKINFSSQNIFHLNFFSRKVIFKKKRTLDFSKRFKSGQ